MNTPIHTIVFDALAFMREHGGVFRKYLFLPVVIAVVTVFLAEIPVVGLSFSAIGHSIALTLIGVSATRFYLLRDPNAVAHEATRPYARFFFLTFAMTFLGNMSEVFVFLPKEYQSLTFLWMLLGLWINLKICLAFPALAMGHPGSVLDNIRESFIWTQGQALRIIGAFLLCYSPLIFFTVMLSKVPEIAPIDGSFWSHLPPLIFSNLLFIFGMLWSSLVLAKFYEQTPRKNEGNKEL